MYYISLHCNKMSARSPSYMPLINEVQQIKKRAQIVATSKKRTVKITFTYSEIK